MRYSDNTYITHNFKQLEHVFYLLIVLLFSYDDDPRILLKVKLNVFQL